MNYNNISNTVVISPNLIPGNPPVSGSLVFGGGVNNPATADARIQFLSNNLINAGGGGAFVNYAATIPIKYKGTRYLIPVLADP